MPHTRPVSESLQEYARGVGGGLLFSLPLLYTMEVWQIGLSAAPMRLVAFVVGTFGLLMAYNHYAGIRAEHTRREDFLESVEEMGLGLAVAAGMLLLLRRFPSDLLSAEALGLLTVEGMIAAVGVSVGTAQLGQSPADEGGDDAEPRSAGGELTVAMCGAVLIAANVAPTEEVLLLGTESTPALLAGLVALSLAVGGGLLYFSASRGAGRVAAIPFGPLGGTLITYAVALVASAALLWAFGHVEAAGLRGSLGPLVVLAFPAMIGASAGRLLLGSTQSPPG
jgi:putative integral membrane protein (TIGR02587 family)